MLFALLSGSFLLLCGPVKAQETAPGARGAAKAQENDGTDPTSPVGSMRLSGEHLDFTEGISSQIFAIEYNQQIGDGATVLRAKVPFAAFSGIGNGDFGLGQIGLKVTRVLTRTRTYGVVVSGELLARTATRRELGTGRWVFKPNLTYARFLKGGHIFAPSILHSISVAGNDSRNKINLTTVDLYFVPRLKNRKLFMTLDPAYVHDWENGVDTGALAVTMGYKTGQLLGARSQVSVKPSVGIAKDRPFNWGFQLSLQLLGL